MVGGGRQKLAFLYDQVSMVCGQSDKEGSDVGKVGITLWRSLALAIHPSFTMNSMGSVNPSVTLIVMAT